MPKVVVNAPTVYSPYGPHAQAARCGPYLFLSGQLAVNPETRRPVTGYADLPAGAPRLGMGRMAPDSREGPGIAQIWQVYQQLMAILRAAGSTEQDLLLMMIYLKDVREFPSVIRVREKIFAPQDPPPSTAAQVAAFALPQSVVCMDAIAVVPDPARGIEKVVVPRTGQFDQMALSHYQLASRAGDLLFVAGVVGARPERGEVIREAADLDEEGRRILAFASRAEQDRDEAVMAQAVFIYHALDGILREHGATLRDLLKTTIYVTDIASLPAVDRVGRLFLEDRPPASTAYEVQQLAMPDFLVEIDGIAVLPGGRTPRETFGDDGVPAWMHSSPVARAGDLVFLSGLMGENPLMGRMAVRAGDLGSGDFENGGEGIACGELEGPVAAQAAAIYAKARRLLAQAGSSLDNVLRTTVYLRDMRDYPIVERLHRRLFGMQAPALMVCQTEGLPLRDARLEVDIIACR
jgi:enamine deaminase RidA (YjgF/YER057c/UK114 family)